MHQHQEREDGRCELHCELDSEGLPEAMHEVDVAESPNLAPEMNISLYKLMSWEMTMHPFTLGLQLPVEPLDKQVWMAFNNYRYWKGQDTQLREVAGRRTRQAAALSKRQDASRAQQAADPNAQPQRQATGTAEPTLAANSPCTSTRRCTIR